MNKHPVIAKIQGVAFEVVSTDQPLMPPRKAFNAYTQFITKAWFTPIPEANNKSKLPKKRNFKFAKLLQQINLV